MTNERRSRFRVSAAGWAIAVVVLGAVGTANFVPHETQYMTSVMTWTPYGFPWVCAYYEVQHLPGSSGYETWRFRPLWIALNAGAAVGTALLFMAAVEFLLRRRAGLSKNSAVEDGPTAFR